MRREYIALIPLTAVLGILLLKPETSMYLRSAMEGKGLDLVFSDKLVLENQVLKSELARYKVLSPFLAFVSEGYLPASVYVREWPFNTIARVTLDAGAKKGVGSGAAVLFAPAAEREAILVGRIREVFPDTSVAETVFDPEWRSAVRVGDAGTEALLVGGITPRLVLIGKNAVVKEGDVVVNASPDLPYGFSLGEIARVAPSGDGLSQEAELRFGYSISHLRTLLILARPRPL